jgi:hypothetical protein
MNAVDDGGDNEAKEEEDVGAQGYITSALPLSKALKPVFIIFCVA